MTAPQEPDLPEPPPPGQRVNRYGRTGALTDDLQDRIVRVIRAGNYLKVAAQFCGIGESTLRLWLQRGRKLAAARDAHPEGHVYCPSCDLDRTADLDAEEQANYRELTRWEAATREYQADPRRTKSGEEPPALAHAVMDRCPSCGSHDRPQPWEPPEAEVRYLSFLEAVTQAETAAEVAAVTHWRSAFPEDWRAARDYLRYTQPDRWSPVTRVSITPEEADKRIEEATMQVLTSLGVDTDAYGGDLLLPGDLDPDSAALDGGPLPGLDDDDGWPGEDDGA